MAKKEISGQVTMQSKNDEMFYLVKDDNGKINICVAGYAVSKKKFDTFKQAEFYLASKPWEIIVNVQYVLTQKVKENENTKENPKNA